MDGIEQRGYATTERDGRDARQTNVVLTPLGERYAAAVVEVIEALHRDLGERVASDDLEAARTVLRAVIAGGEGAGRHP